MAEPHTPTACRSITLSFPCDLSQVRGIALQAHEFLAGEGCAENDILDCELALVEACNNAVEYAPPRARNLPVIVELACNPSQIEMRVSDHTPGFDWPPAPTLPSPENERGRGLYLICSVMRHAQYIKGENGNVLLLRRQRLGH